MWTYLAIGGGGAFFKRLLNTCNVNGNIQPVHEISFKPVGISHCYQLEPSISDNFCYKGCLVVFFIFIQILIELSVSKQ